MPLLQAAVSYLQVGDAVAAARQLSAAWIKASLSERMNIRQGLQNTLHPQVVADMGNLLDLFDAQEEPEAIVSGIGTYTAFWLLGYLFCAFLFGLFAAYGLEETTTTRTCCDSPMAVWGEACIAPNGAQGIWAEGDGCRPRCCQGVSAGDIIVEAPM